MMDDTHSLGANIKHWRLQKGLSVEVIALKTRIPAKYLRALESNDFSALPPIEPSHHTLGELLREYRVRQGLSIESIADRTRVPLASLQALEENNSTNLPEAPVIIRAFVDAYLNCLTLQETEKEIALIQLAKMVDTAYATSIHESADPPPPVGPRAHRLPYAPFETWSDRLHTRALGVYLRLTDWRATFCRRLVVAGHTSLALADHFLDRAGSMSIEAGRMASHKTTGYAVKLMARIRPDGGWVALWQHTLTGLTAGAQRIWRAVLSVCRVLAPLLQRSVSRHHRIDNGR